MFRLRRAILLAAGFALLTFGQTGKPNPQKEASHSAASDQSPKKPNAEKSESLVGWLFRVTGISATSRGLKGDHTPLFSGELWIIDVSTLVRARVGGSHCSTPVFANDDKSILALCEGGLTQISLESVEAHELTKTPREIKRLLATDRTSEPNRLRIVVVTPAGLSIFAPASDELSTLGIPSDNDPSLITSLEEEPQYGSVRVVSLLSAEAPGGKRGAEIFMEIGNTSKRLTQCAPRMCGQGALSHDGARVVFVRSAE
jgi:hypothetical protein